MTKLVWSDQHGTYSVEVPDEDMNIGDAIDRLIKPILLAAGFHRRTVDEGLAGFSEEVSES